MYFASKNIQFQFWNEWRFETFPCKFFKFFPKQTFLIWDFLLKDPPLAHTIMIMFIGKWLHWITNTHENDDDDDSTLQICSLLLWCCDEEEAEETLAALTSAEPSFVWKENNNDFVCFPSATNDASRTLEISFQLHTRKEEELSVTQLEQGSHQSNRAKWFQAKRRAIFQFSHSCLLVYALSENKRRNEIVARSPILNHHNHHHHHPNYPLFHVLFPLAYWFISVKKVGKKVFKDPPFKVISLQAKRKLEFVSSWRRVEWKHLLSAFL